MVDRNTISIARIAVVWLGTTLTALATLLPPNLSEKVELSAYRQVEGAQLKVLDRVEDVKPPVFQVEVPGPSDRTWDAILRVPVSEPIQVGRGYRLSFSIRGTTSDNKDGLVRAMVQARGGDREKLVVREIPVTEQWKRHTLSFHADRAYAAEAVEAAFHLAFQRQTVEIAEWELLALDKETGAVDALPEVQLPGPDALESLRLALKNNHGLGQAQVVEVKHDAFEQAIQVTTEYHPSRSWDIEVKAATAIPFQAGDLATLRFYARRVSSMHETGEALVGMAFQGNGAPWTKSLLHKVAVADDWVLVEQPFRLKESYGAGEAAVTFHLGYAQQIVQLAGIDLIRHPAGTDMDQLPVSPRTTYAGRSPDAAWRTEAQARIERIRKGNLVLRVVDRNDRPIPGVHVRAELIRHDFDFGMVYSNFTQRHDPEEVKTYRELFIGNFNTGVLEAGMKSGPWHSKKWRPKTLESIDWMMDHGLKVRGHWLSHGVTELMTHRLPEEEKANLAADPSQMRRFILEDIRDKLDVVGGRITEWDAINHLTAYWGTPLEKSAGGFDIYIEIMKLCRSLAPDAQLWVNESGILSTGREQHEAEYRRRIHLLINQGAAPDGIGMMAHFGSATLRPPLELWKVLDRYRDEFGLPLKATEFDIAVEDEELKADYLRDFFIALFAHESVEGIVQWGFWGKQHWKPQAALVNNDFTPKPAWDAYKELVQKQWWTAESGETDHEGRLRLRGFHGQYQVTISKDNVSHTVELALHPKGKEHLIPFTK